jgi:hypothetical protein
MHLAGAEGFEPPLAVLETAGLAVKPMPLYNCLPSFSLPEFLLSLPMRLMLAAIGAKLFHLQALRRRPLVLGLTIISVLALAALELNDFTRHCKLISFLFFERLRDDLGDRAGAHRAAAFADRKA